MGNGYERVMRLWVQLWRLVFEEARALDAACAVLQKLVFEHTAYPIYKNWPAISELGNEHQGLMFVIAGLSEDDIKGPVGQKLTAMFPECFSQAPVSGPIPWSYFIKVAEEHPGDGYYSHLGEIAQNPIWHSNVLDYFPGHPPLVSYSISEQTYEQYEFPYWPAHLPRDAQIGDEFEIDDGRWVVVDHYRNDPLDEIHVMPAGWINFDA